VFGSEISTAFAPCASNHFTASRTRASTSASTPSAKYSLGRPMRNPASGMPSSRE
jgi:hypothetical protein